MDELTEHVERIVRPIRASGWRKNKMREELLGHLMESARGEMEQGVAEKEACAAAIERLGDGSALRRELEASVPGIERKLFVPLPWGAVADSWFDKREGESAVRFAFVRTAYTQAFLAVVLAAFGVILTFAGHANPNTGFVERALVLGALFGTQAIATALAYWLADISGVRKVLSRQGDYGLWAKAGAMATFIVGYMVLLLPPCIAVASKLGPGPDVWLVFSQAASGELRWIWPLILLAFFATLPFLGWMMRKEHEHYMKWDRLP